jgi:hypothetical protein
VTATLSVRPASGISSRKKIIDLAVAPNVDNTSSKIQINSRPERSIKLYTVFQYFRRVLVPIILLLICLIGLYISWDFIIEDAFITFRYSKQLVEYGTLEWNPGSGNPVEGYTNFSWVILMAAAIKAGIAPVTASKILSIICFIAVIILSGRIKIIGARKIRLAIMAPLFFIPATYIHLNSGMETVLYTFLLYLVYSTFLRIISGNDKLLLYLPIWGLFLSLTRPEGVLVVLFTFIYLLISNKGANLRSRIWKTYSLLYILPGLVYFIWRWVYFGQFLPNTFYVKVGYFGAGLGWFFNSMVIISPILAVLLWHFLIAKNNKTNRLISASLLFLIFSLLIYTISAPMMDFAFRFLYPALPILLTVIGLIVSATFRHPRDEHKKSTLSLYLLFIICFFPMIYQTDEYVPLIFYGRDLKNCPMTVGKSLNTIDIPQEYKTVAVVHAGAIPYYSDWKTIDIIGLNDETISRKKENVFEYLDGQNPTLVILFSQNGSSDNLSGIDTGNKRFEGWIVKYALSATLQWGPNYYLMIFQRKVLPAEIHSELQLQLKHLEEKINPARVFPEYSNKNALRFILSRIF